MRFRRLVLPRMPSAHCAPFEVIVSADAKEKIPRVVLRAVLSLIWVCFYGHLVFFPFEHFGMSRKAERFEKCPLITMRAKTRRECCCCCCSCCYLTAGAIIVADLLANADRGFYLPSVGLVAELWAPTPKCPVWHKQCKT